jgi:polyisoprenoid-binding protein YceI
MKRSALFAAALTLAGATLVAADAKPLPTGTFKFDAAHTNLGFEVTHLVISTVTGKFDKFDGTITIKSDKDISVVASADTASIDTGNSMRDAHLRGDAADKPKDDFFEAAKYPKLTFKSSQVTLDGDKLTVVGDLTIHGVTKTVTFEGKYRGAINAFGGEHIAASLRSTISRKDYGLKFAYMVEAGPVVGDAVDLVLNVEAAQVTDKK